LENIYLIAFRIVTEQIGHVGFIYFPFLFALFSYILLLNLFSMLPFAFAVTSHLVWTLFFSLSICLGIFFLGIFSHGVDFLKLFVPEVPLALYPLMITIEILSYIIRSFSLAIRLSANIIAGHTLVHILAEFVSVLCSMKKIIIVLPYLLLFAIFILELGVSFLQAYIFVTLTCMYLNDSIHLAAH
jgi:ATP synthase subunit 6